MRKQRTIGFALASLSVMAGAVTYGQFTASAANSNPAKASAKATQLGTVSKHHAGNVGLSSLHGRKRSQFLKMAAFIRFTQYEAFFAAVSNAEAAAQKSAAASNMVVTGGAGGAWAALRQCESGGNYATNTGNGYFGAYQFLASTWNSLGYPGLPSDAPPAMQDEAAQRLQAMSGWGQWPACSARLGL